MPVLSPVLQIGDNVASDTHDVGRCRTKVVVPGSCCCPHLVVLQQVRINEHPQLLGVAERGHANVVFGNLFPDFSIEAPLHPHPTDDERDRASDTSQSSRP